MSHPLIDNHRFCNKFRPKNCTNTSASLCLMHSFHSFAQTYLFETINNCRSSPIILPCIFPSITFRMRQFRLKVMCLNQLTYLDIHFYNLPHPPIFPNPSRFLQYLCTLQSAFFSRSR